MDVQVDVVQRGKMSPRCGRTYEVHLMPFVRLIDIT